MPTGLEVASASGIAKLAVANHLFAMAVRAQRMLRRIMD